MNSPLLRQLAAFCRQHPVARKYVFVPSRQVGYNLGSALATSGCSWVNLDLVTPKDHARALAGPTLVAEGFRAINEDALALLVDRLIADLLQETSDHYFANVPTSGGLARAFGGTLQSLRLSGVSPEAVRAGLTSTKGRFIAEAYHRYTDALAAEKALDDALVFRRASALLTHRNGSGSSTSAFAILDETPVPGLAGAYVESVAHRSLQRLGVQGIDAAPAPHSAAVRFSGAPYVESVEGTVSELVLQTTVGSENEVREVLRRVLDEGLPFDDVEIAYGGEAPYLARLVDVADRFGVPIAFSAGIPATLTRPGQAVLGFLRWIQSDFSADALVDLARGGLLDPILPRAGERALRGHELARQVRLARISGTRSQYSTLLQRRVGQGDGRPGGAAAMSLHAIETMLGLVEEGAEHSIARLARSARAFLNQFAHVSNDRDKVTIDSLNERLEQIEAADPLDRRHEQAAARLLEMLEAHKIAASTAREGAIYAVPISRAGYSGRKHLFVVGLDESTFPGTPIEDPVLLDDERSRLSPALTLMRSGPHEQIWHLGRVLRSGASRAVLLSRRSGIHDAREVYPSAAFQELAESFTPARLPLVASPHTALELSESFLGMEASPALTAALNAAFPDLAAGYEARAARWKGFTVFRGCVGEEVTEDVVPGLSRATSASGLEGFMACPYRYFLRSVLKVRPPEDPPVDPSRWLTSLEFGNLFHEVCRRLMRILRERQERVDVDAHTALINEVLDAVIAEFERDIPPHNEAAYRADVARLRRAAQVFLADEARRDAEPVAFELSFGEGNDEGLNRAEPVVVRLDEGLDLLLRGRIDRVDRVDGGYEIWDYKTGSPSRFDEADLLGGGLVLQWALYAHALNVILEENGDPLRVRHSGYFFVGDRGHGLRYGDEPPAPGHLASVLEPLLEMARAGTFLHLHKKRNACRYCDYREVCESEAQTCADLKKVLENDPAAVPEDLPYRDSLFRWLEVES